MKTICIKISEALDLQLQECSRKRRVSKSSLVRDSLEKTLRKELQNPQFSAFDLMKDGFGIAASGCPDLGSNPRHLKGFGA